MMKAIDEYDIRDTFQALDSDQDGHLTAQQFFVLWQGLGYLPERINQDEFRRQIAGGIGEDSLVSIDQALTILEKYQRNRSEQLQATFQLIDRDEKGYINASDIQQLAQDCGETISDGQAQRMANFASTSEQRLTLADFKSLMSPNEP